MADTTAIPALRGKRRAQKRTAASLRAEERFRRHLLELGATLLEPEFLGVDFPHRVVCPAGHPCSPRPKGLAQGKGMCPVCAGVCPVAAEEKFRMRLQEMGATLLEPYSGSHHGHRVVCAAGHEATAHPHLLRPKRGFCRTCGGNNPKVTEGAFLARLDELGATLLGAYSGARKPVRVQCADGHIGNPRPSDVAAGGGVCRACIGTDPHLADEEFRECLVEHGLTLLEGAYSGSRELHLLQCSEGHTFTSTPAAVRKRAAKCRVCNDLVWNVFYVVRDPENEWIKFGITSRDGRSRLQKHARDGFTDVLRLHTGLAPDIAQPLERQVIAALRDAGETPVRGKEYFWDRALQLVLDLVDNHPAIRQTVA